MTQYPGWDYLCDAIGKEAGITDAFQSFMNRKTEQNRLDPQEKSWNPGPKGRAAEMDEMVTRENMGENRGNSAIPAMQERHAADASEERYKKYNGPGSQWAKDQLAKSKTQYAGR